ncbi:hypothetical protein LTR70_008079 [Exophiala xenobiotica]|uniref:Uncharacterized protein n=1 Tax=Lithohypha guttulata TaxID=1690604 RepID=A0ABR0K466_9EURO|nr:hypothetical protein LTR24_007196 [Lithohypha guttulata]KAK5312636.1 hypothetical protein LTR70_008079 [Exophiala xenobiotica]
MVEEPDPDWWMERNGKIESGSIVFLPSSKRLSNYPAYIYDHPVLVFEVFPAPIKGSETHAWVCLITSRSNRWFRADDPKHILFNHPEHDGYLPHECGQACSGLLCLEDGSRMRRECYLNIKEIHRVPFARLRPFRDRSIKLAAASLSYVFEKASEVIANSLFTVPYRARAATAT